MYACMPNLSLIDIDTVTYAWRKTAETPCILLGARIHTPSPFNDVLVCPWLVHAVNIVQCTNIWLNVLIKCWYVDLLLVLQWFSIISRHGITKPKGLYFTAVVFFFFFWHLISEVTERISTYIHVWLLFEKFGPNSPGILSPWAVGQKIVLEQAFNFDWTYLSNGTWYQQSERNILIYRDSPTCLPNLVLCSGTSLQSGTTECWAGSHWALPCI